MILAAAVKINGVVCFLPAPNRHHHILHSIAASVTSRTDLGYMTEVQGFVTDAGQFLAREDAYRHAVDCGQTITRRAGSYDGAELFSEDLW